MEGVVLHGTGTNARLPGYTVGGKTGSAQIFDFATKHYTHTYNGSFLGFAPLTNPAVVVAVTLNGTHGTAGFGGQAAAPVFRAVAAEALRVLDVPKDLPDEDMVAATSHGDVSDLADADTAAERNILEEDEEDTVQVADAGKPAVPAVGPVAPRPATPAQPTVPNFAGMTMRAVLSEAAARGIEVVPNGSGTARGQSPPAGKILHRGERIRVQFSR
jgi:membrane peptidoglycan carboxypeptidase